MVPFGNYIQVFHLDHWIYIAILIISAVLLFSYQREVRGRRDKWTRLILVISIMQQLILYGAYFVLFDFSLGESLPLHISRINSILGIIYLLTRNRKAYRVLCSFSYFAWLSFLYPSRVYGIMHPIGLSFIINHLVTLLLPYYGMIAYDEKIKKGDKNLAMMWFLVYLCAVTLINPLIDGNYFYLKYRPLMQSLPLWQYLVVVTLFTYGLFSMGEVFNSKIKSRISGVDSLRSQPTQKELI